MRARVHRHAVRQWRLEPTWSHYPVQRRHPDMKANTPTTIAKYIAGFPRPVQLVLKRVRSSIRKALPQGEESISYGIPTYKLNGRPVIYFAGLRQHYSVYPA